VSAKRIVKRALASIAVGSAAALVLFATLSLGHKPSPTPQLLGGRRASQATGAGELRAGAARVELSMPSRGPVAGYPMWRRDDGTGEPIFVRALVLEQGDLHAVVLSLPLLLVPGDLEEAIVHRASLGETDCLLAAATHTHSGPGGTWKNLLVEVGGNGWFKQARADAVAKAAADAIALARQRLGPAHFATGLETWTAGPAVPRSGEIDTGFAAARLLDSDNRTVASILIYAMHATVVPRSEHKLSGDWPEAAARQIEEVSDRAPALVLQGAEGSATFSRAQLPEDPIQAADSSVAPRRRSRARPGSPRSPSRKPAARSGGRFGGPREICFGSMPIGASSRPRSSCRGSRSWACRQSRSGALRSRSAAPMEVARCWSASRTAMRATSRRPRIGRTPRENRRAPGTARTSRPRWA
jgi:hypothetical protein